MRSTRSSGSTRHAEPACPDFLTSNLFLGWALGANNAANVFGTAVGTKMLWRTAAIICSLFIILGAMIPGAGTSQTLGDLGVISALPGAFMTALPAAMAVYLMTKSVLPVSTLQSIVGAIVGWNLFSTNPTDASTLTKIYGTWVLRPVLAAIIAVILFRRGRMHPVMADAYTRLASAGRCWAVSSSVGPSRPRAILLFA